MPPTAQTGQTEMKYSRLATILGVTIVGATSLSLVLADPEKPKRKVSKKALQSTTRSVKPAVTTKPGATPAKPGASDNRSARNIRTGQAIKVKATSVPAFRPGAGFDDASPPPSPPPPPR